MREPTSQIAGVITRPSARPPSAGRAQPLGLKAREQDAPREEPVQGLRPLLLAAHFEAARGVAQDDTGRNFVHILPTRAAGADEGFFQIGFSDAEPAHERFQLGLLLRRDGKQGHAGGR